MKKVLSVLLIAVLMLSLFSACGGSTESAAPESEAPASAAPESETPESAVTESESPESSGWVPTQQVELIIPASAGGATDLLARAVESVWTKYCDQPVVITNMGGGGGVTGAMAVASADPDGYTLELGYGSGHDMCMMYLQELEYDPFTMLEPVCCMSVHTAGVVAPIDSEFESMADVAAWSEANPNTPVSVSVSTANGTADLTMQAVRYYTGINMSIVPHDGGGPAMTDLLSGAYMIGCGHPAEFYTYVQSGQMKVLGIASDERDPTFPDIPTLKEQGIEFSSYGSIKGVAVPVGTPQEIKDYYEELFRQISEDPDFQETMASMAQPVMYMDTEEFTQYFYNANQSNKTMIEDLGLAYYE